LLQMTELALAEPKLSIRAEGVLIDILLNPSNQFRYRLWNGYGPFLPESYKKLRADVLAARKQHGIDIDPELNPGIDLG
jgi:hypothetical protein